MFFWMDARGKREREERARKREAKAALDREREVMQKRFEAQQFQINQAQSAYRAQTESLLAESRKTRDEFNAAQAAALVTKRVAAANQGRGTQAANLKIQQASEAPKTAGTQSFKRRKDQFKIKRPTYMGIGGDVQMPGFKSSMINL